MLPSHKRLSRQRFTELLSRKPGQVYNGLGTFKYVASGTALSVVTSSKHEKSAVIRNKTRRRIYTLFHLANPQLTGILYVSKQSYHMDYSQIKTLFHDLLAKAAKNL